MNQPSLLPYLDIPGNRLGYLIHGCFKSNASDVFLRVRRINRDDDDGDLHVLNMNDDDDDGDDGDLHVLKTQRNRSRTMLRMGGRLLRAAGREGTA